MIIPAVYENDPDAPRGLLVLVKVPGQRWHHMLCFGRKSHYFEDGGCEHTDALFERLTPYGKQVTKLIPFGDKEPPKRPRKRKLEAA